MVSRFYRPPELILGSHNYTSQIDLWSAGCILFELLARTPLFPGETEGMQLYEFVQVLGIPSKSEREKLIRECDPAAASHFFGQLDSNRGGYDMMALLLSSPKTGYSD